MKACANLLGFVFSAFDDVMGKVGKSHLFIEGSLTCLFAVGFFTKQSHTLGFLD